MSAHQVDPESGAARAHARLLSTLALAVVGLLFATLILRAVWSWAPFNLRADIGELETRVDRLERLHTGEHKLGQLEQELQRRFELGPVPEREVPL